MWAECLSLLDRFDGENPSVGFSNSERDGGKGAFSDGRITSSPRKRGGFEHILEWEKEEKERGKLKERKQREKVEETLNGV